MEDRPYYWLDEDPDGVIRYDSFHHEVGRMAREALDSLSLDVTQMQHDDHGWTEADSRGVSNIAEVDQLSALMVPPPGTSLEPRRQVNAELVSLRDALPLANAERQWLFTGERRMPMTRNTTDDFPTSVRGLEAELVSEGVSKTVRGDELLDRLRSWRRQEGVYAGGEGLAQARCALAGLVGQLTPDLELPESYTSMKTSGR